MFLLHNYQKNVDALDTAKPSILSYTLTSIILCLIAGTLAASVYLLLIKPVNPPSKEPELIIALTSLPIVSRAGLYTDIHLPNTNIRGKEDTNNKQNVPGNTPQKKTDNQDNTTFTKQYQAPANPKLTLNHPQTDTTNKTPVETIQYNLNTSIIKYLLAIAPLILCLIILLKLILRRLWLYRIRKLKPRHQVTLYYQIFLKRFQIIGLGIQDGETHYEYSKRLKTELSIYDVNNISFHELTDIFVESNYGYSEISNTALSQFSSYYKGFFKNCKRNIGIIKYTFKYILL